MIRLPDTYYTRQMLDGNPPQEGVYQAPPLVPQGDDGVFDILLNIDGVPLTTDHWDVVVYVKRLLNTDTIMWTGHLGEGVLPIDHQIPGFYRIWIPAKDTALLVPGAYFLAIQAIERVGEGGTFKDRTVVVHQSVFDVTLASSSPNPRLRVSGPNTTTLVAIPDEVIDTD